MIPRHKLVDAEHPMFYHLVSRCVRRTRLCGFDRFTQRDYSHRKEWLINRMKRLGRCFAVEVYSYAVMSNHFHMILYYDPKAPENWTDLEVVDRWLSVTPPKLPDGSVDEDLLELRRNDLLASPADVAAVRKKLGSLSLFMKLLKQPIARRANLEDDVTGHFFEQRFYSSPLLCEEAVQSAMAYVDLNPVRAKIARSIAESEHTSIYERVRAMDHEADLDKYLKPVVSGLSSEVAGEGEPQGQVKLTLAEYIDRLEVMYTRPSKRRHWTRDRLKRWRTQIELLGRRQRVYGPAGLIEKWISQRGLQMRELPTSD